VLVSGTGGRSSSVDDSLAAPGRTRTIGIVVPTFLMVPPLLRASLARFLRSSVPSLHVLGWNEVPDNRKVRLVGTVGKQ